MGNKNYADKPIVGNGKNKGMQFDSMYKGLDLIDFDGSPSIPLQGGSIINKEGKKLKRIITANPGIAEYMFMPILGSVPGQSTLASIADMGETFWRSIRSATPHAEQYQAGDVITEIALCAALRYGAAKLKRIIKSYNFETSLNTYVTDAFWRVYTHADQSAELTDVTGLTATLINKYNAIMTRMGSVPIPDIFPVMHRWEYMTETIFRDHKDPEKAQFIIFTPGHAYDFELRDPDDPGVDLVPQHLEDDPVALADQLFAIAKHLTSDSSMSAMFSDIVLTYPEAQWLKWETITKADITDKFESVYDVDILYALHNAQIANTNVPRWFVSPKTGSITGDVFLPDGKKAVTFEPPICNAVIEEKIDAKRMEVLYQWVLFDEKQTYDTASNAIHLINVPTDILTAQHIYYWGWSPSTGDRLLYETGAQRNYTTWAGTVDSIDPSNINPVDFNWFARRGSTLTFAWAPMIRVNYVQIASGSSLDTETADTIVQQTQATEFVELERPFIADPKQIAYAHDAQRIGLWAIPQKVFNGKRNGNK